MITAHITHYNKDTRTEYQTEYIPPETLTTYSLYERIETAEKPLRLFAIGGTEKDGYSDNWDIYADENGTLLSIPRPSSGACGTWYGDINHIKRLQRQGIFCDTLTAYGKKLMEGEQTA